MNGENSILALIATTLCVILGITFYKEALSVNYTYSWMFLPISWLIAAAVIYSSFK